jgi:predicted amidohydrolase
LISSCAAVHLVDPSQGIDASRDVAFSDGKVVAIRERIDEAGRDTRDVGRSCSSRPG